jgi:hypothetical protein
VIFLAVREVDAQSYEWAEHLEWFRQTISSPLEYYVDDCPWYASDRRAHEVRRNQGGRVDKQQVFCQQTDLQAGEFPDHVAAQKKPVEMQMRLHLPRQTDGALADECRINADL